MTGIGGQGIQLAAAVLARAAVLEGREVQVFGSYGGMMRGGPTESTLVVGDGPIEAPPTAGSTWSALLMHHEHAGPVLARLRPDGVVLVNSSVVSPGTVEGTFAVVEVPAGEIAGPVGGEMLASMVLLGAYAAATGMVGADSLSAVVVTSLPPYRAHHAEHNRAALEAGFDSVTPARVPAWPGRLVA